MENIERYYYSNGKKQAEYYILNRQIHNENGPAKILYYKDGKIKIEEYWINNKRHNENGPAIIFYDKNGEMQEHYWINGKRITDDLQIMVIKGLKNGRS